MKRVSLSVYDYKHRKLCDLYDSEAQAEGQAYDIVLEGAFLQHSPYRVSVALH